MLVKDLKNCNFKKGNEFPVDSLYEQLLWFMILKQNNKNYKDYHRRFQVFNKVP